MCVCYMVMRKKESSSNPAICNTDEPRAIMLVK